MSSFSSQFQAHIAPSEADIAEGMRQGLIVLDTNVLLSAYRFAPKAREELLTVLEKARERVWIPYQVGFEFHKNRFEVIAEHDAAYRALLDVLSAHRKTVESDLESKIRQLSNRSALPDSERDQLLALSKRGLEPLQREIERLHKSHGLSQPTDSDPVLARFQTIFIDHVGPPFAPEELLDVEKEAARRVEEKVPPGYKDASKSNPNGDYYLWAQTLAEAARRRPRFVVLVTGDVKDDWYLRVKGQTITGRPELAIELQEKANARLLLMPTKSFLRHAGEYLDAVVSTDTLQQAGQVQATVNIDSEDRVGISATITSNVMQMIQDRNFWHDAMRRTAKEIELQEEILEGLKQKLESPDLADSEVAALEEQVLDSRIALEDLLYVRGRAYRAAKALESRLAEEAIAPIVANIGNPSDRERNFRNWMSRRRPGGEGVRFGPTVAG